MTQYKTLTDLFLEWKSVSQASNEFTEDGIIYPDRWAISKKKILFVLKEPGEDPTKYIDCKSDSLLDLYRQWKGAKFSFNYLGRTAYGIQNATKEGYPSYETACQAGNKDEAFLSTAFMNLKKTPTARSNRSTDTKVLEAYVKKYAIFIKDQILIIQPDVVISCGDVTDSFLRLAILNSDSNEFRKMVFLKTCHPTARSWRNSQGIVRRKKSEGYKELLDEYLKYL